MRDMLMDMCTTCATSCAPADRVIAPDKLSGIFESFVTTKSDGLGLGLSIARSIVRSHGGRIWAENRTDGGAAFHFTVKVAQGET